MYEFRWPTRTLFGAGLAERVGEFLEPSKGDACLVIVAPGEPWAKPLLGELAARLEAGGWSRVVLFAEVEANPSWETIERGQSFIRGLSADAVLAVGGGSAMDAAKVIAERGGVNTLCTMPTTAGTGGEISPWAVITHRERREKESVVAMWPDMAILDPSLTISMPPATTLYTGIDAFVHGLEAYLSSAANAITDSMALAGMRLAVENLDRVMNEPRDLAGRAAMLEASLLTGASMLHAGLGFMHAIANVVGGLYHDLPHGLILAGCMSAVLDYNRPVSADRLARMEDMVAEMQELLEVWFGRLGVERVSVDEADLPLLAERAAANVNARTNPRPAEKEQLEELARQAFRFESGISKIGNGGSGEDA